jgi:hypothetical protein
MVGGQMFPATRATAAAIYLALFLLWTGFESTSGWNGGQLPLLSRRNALTVAGGVGGLSLLDIGGRPCSSSAAVAAEPNFIPGVSKPQKMYTIGSWSPPELNTSLAKSRIGATKDLSPLAPTTTLTPELFYPSYFEGTWTVTSTLKRKSYPFGINYVPSNSLVEGSPRYRFENVDDSTSYQVRYIPLPLQESVSSVSSSDSEKASSKDNIHIISDRVYNAMTISRAYQQFTPVKEAVWDPNRDPTRLTFSYGAGLMTEDLRPLGERRTEVYLTARKSESIDIDSNGNSKNSDVSVRLPVFGSSERSRSVTLSPGNVLVSDIETITELSVMDDNDNCDRMQGISRIAVFLTPNPNNREGVMWQQVGGKAVAYFDYEIQMNRLVPAQ